MCNPLGVAIVTAMVDARPFRARHGSRAAPRAFGHVVALELPDG
jgi:hypothetical protein